MRFAAFGSQIRSLRFPPAGHQMSSDRSGPASRLAVEPRCSIATTTRRLLSADLRSPLTAAVVGRVE